MDTFETIRKQRAVRAYADRDITDAQLLQVLDAGRRAGSAKNRQPWHFLIVRDRARREALARCGRYASHLPQTPVVIAIVMPGEGYWDGVDAGRAAQNMMLAATSLGLGSCIATLHDAACARQILGLPSELNAQLTIGLGVPASEEPTAEERQFLERVLPLGGRRPLSEMVHYERWEQQAPEGHLGAEQSP
ncbi:MAG TPA: nitroreductase family protein [Ardenticatenaceae bacterium]|nr:nitroreductase family protein [Ardenticatenaceae bacterium]